MESVGVLLRPRRPKSKTPLKLSKEHRERDRSLPATPSTPGTPRSSHPVPLARTVSAPLVADNLHSVEEHPNIYNVRDSVVSIGNDSFFRNYQSPQSLSLTRELRSATYTERIGARGADEPRSNATMDNPVNISRSPVADINIAIVGRQGVGKSTLITKALGLRTFPSSIASSLRMSVDNVLYTVSLVELDLESLDINTDGHIQWPKQVGGQPVPRIDGALLLYDVMNRESIVELPATLNALVDSSIPTILVSCKCDNPENTRQIDVDSMEVACFTCVEAVKTAFNVPETCRQALSSILRAITANRSTIDPVAVATAEMPFSRRRATSTAHLENAPNLRPLSQSSRHSRASSEYSLLRGFPSQNPSSTPSSSRLPPLTRSNNGRFFRLDLQLPDPHSAPPLSAHPAFQFHDSFHLHHIQTSSDSNHRPSSPLVSPGGGRAADTSLYMEESDADSGSHRYSDDVPILERSDDTFFDKPAKVLGVTFDELVERLLSQPMAKKDIDFQDIFLCLYRKFAAPAELFGAIDARLQAIAEDQNTHYLTRTATQLRIITVVAKWVSTYPGDFASPATSSKLDAFITNLASDPVFAVAAQEMRSTLQSRVFEDDDTGWARTDADVENGAGTGPDMTIPLRRKTESKASSENISKVEEEMDEIDAVMERKQSHSGSTASTRPDSPNQSLTQSQSSSPSFNTVEDYEKEAATLLPRGTLPLTKFRYHIFMDIPEDDFADELTRIDWVMFSSIRLRDLVRHVSLGLQQKEKLKSLANVNRMISHFNHIAKWVANMILMRDKAKHRAVVLEKFMTIALKLRQLNNYNGLAAVLAGVNSTAIHRLAQTRALVPAEVQKRFARLVILMGTQKSHFAYRLAWENSSLPRIPFIPLHRRDLVSAEEGSRTFVGEKSERINWKKFEILMEVILPIMKSQVEPYPNLVKHGQARELILDCRMPTDEEEVYQRSVSLEGNAPSGSFDAGKKKFPWFQKDK